MIASLSFWPVCIKCNVCLWAFLSKIRKAAVKRRIHIDNVGLHGIIA